MDKNLRLDKHWKIGQKFKIGHKLKFRQKFKIGQKLKFRQKLKIWTKIEICVTNRNFGEKKVFLVKTKSFLSQIFVLPKIKNKTFFAPKFRLVTQISNFVQISNFYIFIIFKITICASLCLSGVRRTLL